MKLEIINKLEQLLESENILSVQKEFNQLSAQYRALAAEKVKELADSIAPEQSENNKDSEEKATLETLGDKVAEASKDVKTAALEIASEIEKELEEQVEEIKEKSEEKAAELKSEIEADTASLKEKAIAVKENAEEKIAEVSADAAKAVDEMKEEISETLQDGKKAAEEKIEEIKDDVQVKFEAISDTFRAKIKTAIEKKNKIEKETVESARNLLAELKELVENEENIGKAFATFNGIKDKWKELPKVSNDAYRELNIEYNKIVEKFFYNINIYKELKDLDLKHNLEEKLKVLEDQKHLLDVTDVRRLEVEVRLNQDRWNEIGPTYKEEWDKVKDEFWSITKDIYKRIQSFYNERRGEQDKNLEVKKELLNRVKYLNSLELKAHKKWQEKTKEVIAIQKEWKMVGFVPKEHASAMWKEFRTTCDAFFEKKRKHYDSVHEVQNANKDAKLALVKKAEELKESTDWNETSKSLIQLQKEWKKIGPAHQRDENKLWKKFREACDQFFQAKKGHKVEETEGQSQNLEQKNALLEELSAYSPSSDKKESLDALKAFGDRWRAIGHVPFKDKDKVNKQYKDVMDEKYGILKIDKKQKEQIRFEQKVEDFKGTDKSDFLIRKEHDHIRNHISKLKKEIIQLENNMGFFASSAGADKFKAEIEKKISKAKEEMKVLQDRLSVLRKL